MIESLTPEQESLLDVYAKKYIDIGFRTNAIDEKKAIEAVNYLYDLSELKRPEHIIFFDSPWECQVACNLINSANVSAKVYEKVNGNVEEKVTAKVYENVRAKVDDRVSVKVSNNILAKVYAKVYAKIYDKVHANVRVKVHNKVHDKVLGNIHAKVYEKVLAKVSANVRAKVDDKIYAKVLAKVNAKVREKVTDRVLAKAYAKVYDNKLEYFYSARSNMWLSWYGYLEYFVSEVIKEEQENCKELYNFINHSKEFHQVYTFEDIAIVCNFPKEIHVNENGDLHNLNGPALSYRDGFSLYASNGIEMKEEYILTPASKITGKMYIEEENADMKREILRKAGLNRIFKQLNPKTLDTLKTKTGGKYELLEIKLSNDVTGKFLKMKCPSTKHDHIIGVSGDCDTAKKAWCFLNNEQNFDEAKTGWEA